MTTAYEVPLTPQAQKFAISLGGVTYNLRFIWNDISATWTLDIADVNNVPLVQGIPLVTGIDLLGQYQHLGIAGSLIVQTDFQPTAMPTFDNLGISSHLFFVTTP